MSRLTVSLTDTEQEVIEEKAGDGEEYESKSEFVRMCIRDHKQVETRIEDLERDVARLQNEKQVLLEQREEHTELVEYVENERQAEQRWREAGLLTRTKWKLFGMSDASSQSQQPP